MPIGTPTNLHRWGSAASATSHTTTAATTGAPAGSTCVASVALSGVLTAPTLTDSAGNVWTRSRLRSTSVTVQTAVLFYSTLTAPIVAGVTTFTVGRTESTGSVVLAVDHWPGARTDGPPFRYSDAGAATALGRTVSTEFGVSMRPGDVLVAAVSSTSGSNVFTPAAVHQGAVTTALSSTVSANRRLTTFYDDPTDARDVHSSPTMGGTLAADGAWAIVAVSLRPPLVGPTVNAGADQSVAGGAVVTLSATAVEEPDGPAIASVGWSQVSGPSVALSSSTSYTPSFVAPSLPDNTATIVLRWTATDTQGRAQSDDVAVTVTPVAPAPAYTVELRLGPLTFTVEQGGTMDAGTDPVLVLDGLSLGWRYASEGWPAALEPLQATVGLATSNVAVLADLDVGDVASVRCIDSEGTVFAAVYGHVSELTAEQRMRGRGAAMRVWTFVTAKVVDASVANNVPVTLAAPSASQYGRVRAIAAQVPYPIRNPPQALTPAPFYKSASIEESGVVELLRAYTAKGELLAPERGGHLAIAGYVPPAAFLQLAPVCMPDGTFVMLSLHAVYFDTDPAELPARLAVVDGELRLIPAIGSPNAIDGARVRLEGQWRKGAENSGDAVTVRDSAIAVTTYRPGLTGAARRTAIRSNRAADDYTATRDELAALGPLYLGESQARGWDREGFTYTPADPVDLSDAWFPNWSTERFDTDVRDPAGTPTSRGGTPAEPSAPCFRRPVAVFGIPDGHNLAGVGAGGGAGVYAGILTAVDITIAAGQVSVGFAMRRQVHRPIGGEDSAATTPGLSYAELRTIAPAITYRGTTNVVDPGLTLADLRIARD